MCREQKYYLAERDILPTYVTHYPLEMRTLMSRLTYYQELFYSNTLMVTGIGVLNGITLPAKLGNDLIDALPITVHVSDHLDYIYPTMLSEHPDTSQRGIDA